jgi:hypothetical protein
MTSRAGTWLSSPSWGGQRAGARRSTLAAEDASGGVVSAADEERGVAGTPCPATPVPRSRRSAQLACLRCQLVGQPGLLCAEGDACPDRLRVLAVGPLLLLGWAAMTIAFLAAVG